MDTITLIDSKLLWLLQLASPALPVGGYSYSEGLETLIDDGAIANPKQLKHWLEMELRYGAIRIEAAIMIRGYQSILAGDFQTLSSWNNWLTAARETEELRASSLGMGRSLMRLLIELQPQIIPIADTVGHSCNYAIAFSIAAAHWQINIQAALLGYLYSWANNLVTAGVKLIPLGQTSGQKLLLQLHPFLSEVVIQIQHLEDDNLNSCTWGLSLASMRHEKLYTRLFRS